MNGWLYAIALSIMLVAVGFLAGRVSAPRQPFTVASPMPTPTPAPMVDIDTSPSSLQFKLALSNETDFERGHKLHPRFADCQPSANNDMACSTFTDEGAPVVYRCSYQGCAIACGVTK